MEGNRDDSVKCIHLAEKYIKTGDLEKAKKFLEKAERLYPSDRAKALLRDITKSDDNTSAEENDTSSRTGRHSAPNSPKATRRERRDSRGDCHEIQPKYSQEQLEAVRKIRKCKDYYEILGVPKECTEDDLKKAYRKLALKFHPDKNHAPGATEAFKAIGNAFAVLSDSSKRKRYDEFGNEEEATHRGRRPNNGYDYDYSRGFEGDISAEDLFRMFFGGGVFQQNHQPSRHRPSPSPHSRHAHQQNDNPFVFLLQLSPLIIIVVLSLLSSLLVGSPVYSLRRDGRYAHERKTSGIGVLYYVRSDFAAASDPAALKAIEQQVEDDYIIELQQQCFRERQNKETALWRARMYGNNEMYKQANNMRLSSCERLRSFNIG